MASDRPKVEFESLTENEFLPASKRKALSGKEPSRLSFQLFAPDLGAAV
jgi:hypothetical protein